MLDKMIHSHIDDMDELEDDIQDAIDKILNLNEKDISDLVENPILATNMIASRVFSLIEDEYSSRAVQLGVDFAKDIEKRKNDIVLQSGDDPDVNKDIV